MTFDFEFIAFPTRGERWISRIYIYIYIFIEVGKHNITWLEVVFCYKYHAKSLLTEKYGILAVTIVYTEYF